MTEADIFRAMEEYVFFLENSQEPVVENLLKKMDALVYAYQQCAIEIDSVDVEDYPEEPENDYQRTRARFARNFPHLGYYNIPQKITEDIGGAGCQVGDAIDDITDIYQDIKMFLWRRDYVSPQYALWSFRYECFPHWQAHARGLQYYLFSVECS